MSDSLEDVYEKYLGGSPSEEPGSLFVHDPRYDEGDLTCPKCDSTKLDRKAGYRGEYTCRDCGFYWKTR